VAQWDGRRPRFVVVVLCAEDVEKDEGVDHHFYRYEKAGYAVGKIVEGIVFGRLQVIPRL